MCYFLKILKQNFEPSAYIRDPMVMSLYRHHELGTTPAHHDDKSDDDEIPKLNSKHGDVRSDALIRWLIRDALATIFIQGIYGLMLELHFLQNC